MNVFYAILQQDHSEADVLALAQNAMITGNYLLQTNQSSATERASIDVVHHATGENLNIANNFSYPYYWAPFILIGNGL